jgi:hypothetical protein
MTEVITCETAAKEVRERLGLGVHGLATASLVERLDRCKRNCPGSPRVRVIGAVYETVAADAILALLN